jgi:hypothetical protein
MAGTQHSRIATGRRWGLAAAGGLTVLALTAGLGNPWSAGFFARLGRNHSLDRVAALVHTGRLLRWSTGPTGFGAGPAANHAAWYAGILTLDLGWPLLFFFALRILAGGLLQRRGGVSLLLAGWALAVFTGAVAALAGGMVQFMVGEAHRMPQSPGALVILPGTQHVGAVLTIQAASVAMLAFVLGWLPALVALLGYSIARLPEWDVNTGEEATMVDLRGRDSARGVPEERETLSLAALEELRNARYGFDYEEEPDEPRPSGMADPRTSTFFGDGQY